MFEKIRKMKNQKGFTLVELIVVLVILAILAALLVPALTGYIDKANKQKVIATTRMVVMAAQTEASEKYGLKADGKLSDNIELKMNTVNGKVTLTPEKAGDVPAGEIDGINIATIAELAEVYKDSKFVNGVTDITVKIDNKGHVTETVVKQGNFECTYKAEPGANEDKYTVK